MASSTADPRALAAALLRWWDRHGRHDLPWQRDPTPYRVWVSEIMLQQTQVATVARYYDRFLAAFPDVATLAAAPVDRVLHLWSGLGYYARARNLHRAAQAVVERHGGALPEGFDELAALPGIGRSTAGAVLALSRGRRHAILDGNVKRVLARLYRVEGNPASPPVLRELWARAEALTPAARVADYTQAIMDLGASLCARRRPACAPCPWHDACAARRAGVQESLPSPKPRRARPRRATVVMLVVERGSRVLLEQRPADGLWGGLWGLPEVARVEDAPAWCERELGARPARVTVRPVLRHGFTHFDLDMTPVEAHLAAPAEVREAAPGPRVAAPGRLWYNLREPAEVGLAAPVARLIHALGDDAPEGP